MQYMQRVQLIMVQSLEKAFRMDPGTQADIIWDHNQIKIAHLTQKMFLEISLK